MGKLLIRFDKHPAVFEPGETISGRVEAYVKEEAAIKEIVLMLRGRAQTQFEVHHGSGRGGTTYHYKAEELYFEKRFVLFSSEVTEPTSPSPFGTQGGYFQDKNAYEYHFSYTLPTSIPTSFESEIGWIRYACKLIVKKPFRLNLRKTRLFTVVAPCDLNANLSAKNRQCDESTANVGYMCCSPNRGVTTTVALPKMGYVPGEVIPIEAKVVNHTSRSLKGSKVKLVRVVRYTGQLIGLEYGLHKPNSEDSIERVHCIAEAVKYEDIPPNDGVQTWNNQGVLIPPIPPCLGPCKCIKISYFIIFKVKPRGLAGVSLSLELPVIIGTIPLNEEVSVGMETSQTSSDGHLLVPKRSTSRKLSLFHPMAPIPATFLGTRESKYLGEPNYDYTPALMRHASVNSGNRQGSKNFEDVDETEETNGNDGNDDDNDKNFQPKYGYFNLSMDAIAKHHNDLIPKLSSAPSFRESVM